MKKILKVLLVIIIVFVLAAAGLVLKFGPNYGLYILPPSVEQYVEGAMKFADFGIYAEGKEWKEAKASAIEKAAECESYEETYPIIQEALSVAGGKHSKLITKEQSGEWAEEQLLPECDFDGGILYVKLPPYSMESGESKEYTDIVINAIKDNGDSIKGVILDLRDNTGGDMGPMVAAVSPLIPDGVLMQFDVSGRRMDVTLSEGTVNGGGSTTTVENLNKLSVPVAILQNELTASSGEATLICFKGLDNVRTFGAATAGYCRTNTVRKMYDGAVIQLTVGSDVDRQGNMYCEDPIEPDVPADDPLKEAKEWIGSF